MQPLYGSNLQELISIASGKTLNEFSKTWLGQGKVAFGGAYVVDRATIFYLSPIFSKFASL